MKKITALVLSLVLCLSLTACVDQHPQESTEPSTTGETAPQERRIIATSPATLEICDRLGLDLVAIPTTASHVPERYQGLPEVGTAMAPDAETISILDPTDVIGPDTLAESIAPGYEAAGIPFTFIDLQSGPGMYDSIAMLGEKYGVQEAAHAMIQEYEDTMAEFHKAIEGKPAPKVLVLMGLPGAYIECTPNSYVGSLVELAGGVSVVQDDFMNFVSWNTEELLALDPDVILLTAHGLPDAAMKMFSKEFTTNDIWQHFRAVQNNQVYELDFSLFNMSCTFDWPEALDVLEEILYEGTYTPYVAEPAE